MTRTATADAARCWSGPATDGQRQVWFESNRGGSDPYLVASMSTVRGDLDLRALAAAYDDLVALHPALRTVFTLDGVDLVQTVLPEVPTGFSVVDGAAPSTTPTVDLARGPLLHMTVRRTGPEENEVGLVAHHIAVDGWSLQVLHADLAELYDSARTGRPSPLRSPAHRAAVAATHRRAFSRPREVRAGPGARTVPAGNRSTGLLRGVREGRGRASTEAVRACVDAGAERTAALKALARERRSSRAAVALAVTAAWVVAAGGRSRFVVGTPLAGRTSTDVEHVVGFLAGTGLVPFEVGAGCSAGELVDHAAVGLLDALAGGAVPADDLLAAPGGARAPRARPFDLMVLFDDGRSAPLDLPGTVTSTVPSPGRVRHDVTVTWDLAPQGWRVHVTARRSGCTPERLAALAAAMDGAISRLAAGSHEPVRESVGPSPRRPDEDALTAALLPSRPRGGDSTALECADLTMTHDEFRAAVRRLASSFADAGVRRGDAVGLLLPHDERFVLAFLALLDLGATTVPLDRRVHGARWTQMVLRTEAVMLVVDDHDRRDPDVDGLPVPVAVLDRRGRARALPDLGGPAAHGHGPVPGGSAAYVLHTSGSTGTPKGVVVPRSALAAYVGAVREEFPGLAGRVLVQTSFAVDFTLTALLGALSSGGVVALVDPYQWVAHGHDGEVTFLKTTPGLMRVLPAAARRVTADADVVSGGEQLSWDALRSWDLPRPGVRTTNHYGPTEATVGCLRHRVGVERPVDANGPLPVGRPFPHADARVLDDRLRAVAPGDVGELYVGGAGLASGCLDDPSTTAQRFVASPWGPPGSRCYRTGDLATVRATGDVVLVGRADRQVKVDGHRVELDDVERTLRDVPGVVDAAVVADETSTLVAHVVLAGVDKADVAHALRERLPAPMVPRRWLLLTELPRLGSGKTDHALLTLLSRRAGPGAGEDECTGTDGGTLVEDLCRVWAELLGRAHVDPDDDVFAMGASSLLALRAMGEASELVGRAVPVEVAFDHPTARAMAQVIGGAR